MVTEKFHCIECAGHAKRKGEKCFTCDGEGNELIQDVKVVTKPKKKSK